MPAAKETADRLIAEGNRAEDRGQLSEAHARYAEAVKAAPDYAKAHLNLGIALEALGQAEDAARSYEAALSIDPADANAHYNLGKLHFVHGALERSERHLRAALERRREFPQALMVLGSVLEARGDVAGAAVALQQALTGLPDDFGGWLKFGLVLRRLDRLGDAESALKRALAIDGANADAHAALSDLYESQGKLAQSAGHLETVLALRPDWIDARYNYGTVLMRMQRLAEAAGAFEAVIARDPEYRMAYRMLGSVLQRAARSEEMIEICRLGRQRFPDWYDLESFELFGLNFTDGLSMEEMYSRHAAFGARLERATPLRFAPYGNSRDPERRLRIGFLSGDFSYHVVALFTLPLVDHIDRTEFEVYCYSAGNVIDAITRQVKARADVWRDVSAMSDEEVANAIARDGIDILLDLAGPSGIQKLPVFARQPAPVQATWLGYLNTTGLKRIHYRITDGYCDPPGHTERFHTEALMRMPHSQWCYRPFVSLPCAAAAPCESNGFVTFGSFNQTAKLSPAVRQLWAAILNAIPGSRLLVAGVQDARIRDKFLAEFAAAGIGAARIDLRPHGSLQDYFRWYNEVDLGLDPLLYSGGTTTLDALWMGVPVVTAPGERPASRSAASILSSVGLTEWVAASNEDYVRRAVSFASDAGRIAGLRRTLRARLFASPLMDEAGFARDMGSLYRQMWRRWCGENGFPANASVGK